MLYTIDNNQELKQRNIYDDFIIIVKFAVCVCVCPDSITTFIIASSVRKMFLTYLLFHSGE